MSNFEEWKKNYLAEKKRILSDETLTDLEKENAIRKLSGLAPAETVTKP